LLLLREGDSEIRLERLELLNLLGVLAIIISLAGKLALLLNITTY